MGLYSDYEVNINITRQNRNKETWLDIFKKRSKSLKDLPSTEVYDGWRRSAALGLDPYAKSVKKVADPSELKRLQQENSFFFNTSQPMLENINSFVFDAGFNVAISDRSGIILTVLGHSQVVDATRAGNWVAGADWSEESIGNNGIGTCLKLDKPIVMIGYEHYSRCSHNFASAVAPIHDDRGQLLGCIALCGRFEKIHAHTLGLVIAAARAIEIQFEIKRTLKQKEKANLYKEMVFNSINDAIISADSEGLIKFCNRRCDQLLDVPHSKLIGRNIYSIFEESIAARLANPAIKVQDAVVSVQIGGQLKKFICTAQHVMGTGSGDGLVIALSDYDRVVRAAKKIVKSKPKWMFPDLVGQNKEFRELLRMASVAAQTNSNIFILGESGTGKDVLAQAIHNESPRSEAPLVALNCGAIPKDLIASELFGYAEGAFTGAKKGGQAGKFEAARGGTVFLDEIGEMPMEQQVVLLRVLDESAFSRVGSSDRISVNARIIAATNKDISEAIGSGLFRQDLFYRLNVFTLTTVPLRRRPDDIEHLANTFIKKISDNAGQKYTPLKSDVLDMLMSYDWPGNIRELQNVMERGFYISPDGVIRTDTLRLINLPAAQRQPLQRPPISADNPVQSSAMFDRRSSYEADLLRQDLERNKWSITQTCVELNVSRSTLYRWMKKYNLGRGIAVE